MRNQFSFLLKPSLIDGVGVFAARSIKKKGESLRLFSSKERVITVRMPSKYPPQFLQSFCIRTGKNSYDCPADFSQMSVGWYLNHSDDPNVGHCNFDYFSIRAIHLGEELTVNYREFEEYAP